MVIASVEAYLISELLKKLLLASLEAYQLRQKPDSLARNLAKASVLLRLDLIHIFEGADPQPFWNGFRGLDLIQISSLGKIFPDPPKQNG